MKGATAPKPAVLFGAIKWFDPAKGFGFILPDLGGSDVYLPLATLREAGIDTVDAGTVVRYTLGNDKGKLFAATVIPMRPARKGARSSMNNGSTDPCSDFEREWGLKPA